MIDLLQIQEDCFGLLLSAPLLANVNVVLERKLLTQSAVELDTIWTTNRNGRSGAGILVEMPFIDVPGKQSPGPTQNLRPSFLAFQNGDMALTPDVGVGLTAEEIAQRILDALHMQELQGIGTLYAIDRAVEPAREFEPLLAYRVTLFLKAATTAQTARCAPVTVSVAAGSATLTCTTSGAEIFYTLDGSLPVNAQAKNPVTEETINAQAQLYTAPFAVTAGQVLRAVAFKAGCNAGPVAQSNIT